MTRSKRTTLFALLLPLIAAALSVSACGGGGAAPATGATMPASGAPSATIRAQDSRLGKILVDAQGRTLYLFKADSGSASACDGACATAWPPLLANGHTTVADGLDASLVSTITRPGGGRQITYHGHPLYRFADDASPGDINGEAVSAFGASWYVVSPAGNQVTGPPSASSFGGSSSGASGY
jgi:predicted lipoprotein with Yx(FWY)xxD motif